MLFMGLLNFVFLICSLKTDIVHVIIFTTLVIAFGLLTGEYFYHAMGVAYQSTYEQLAVVCNFLTILSSNHCSNIHEGCRSLLIHNCHVSVVQLLRPHARDYGIPIPNPSWRSLTCAPGQACADGTYGLKMASCRSSSRLLGQHVTIFTRFYGLGLGCCRGSGVPAEYLRRVGI
jgi:hypothetical protein